MSINIEAYTNPKSKVIAFFIHNKIKCKYNKYGYK